MILGGNYLLKVDIGDVTLNLDVQSIKEFTIIQDMNKFLPELRVRLVDPQGILTHISPFDRVMSEMSVQIGKGIQDEEEEKNRFDFVVYRRQPEGVFGPSATYDARGLLKVENFFAPDYCRGWKKSIKSILEDIAEELGCESSEISPSLDTVQTVIQPQVTNIEFLTMLRRGLEGKNGEGAYQIFIKQKNEKSIFVCKTIEDLIAEKVLYKFIVNDNPVEDWYPILQYEIMDNYRVFGAFGASKQSYSYFDYYNSEFVETELEARDFLSLADYFLIDKDDPDTSKSLQMTGRSNDFTRTFIGKVKANYYRRLNSLVKMWIFTWGIENICPGDVVQVLFGQGQGAGELFSYQFSGYWLVERVVHMFGTTHRMQLLLTRNGVDTDKDTSLVAAEKRKQ